MGFAGDTMFSPSFGNRPVRLVGRGSVLDLIASGLESRQGSKGRAVVLTGQRGYGKTVLLWEIADLARERGFAVVNPTAVREGMVARIAEKLGDESLKVFKPKRREITGGSLGALGFSAGVSFAEREASSRSPEGRLEHLVRDLSAEGIATLLLVDEIQANSSEVRRLVETYQELVGEGLDVAIVLAGLPAAVSGTLNDHVLTFLNRATKIELTPLDISEVDAYFYSAFRDSDVEISSDLRRRASAATEGSPYLMQLVGHYLVLYAGQKNVDEKVLEEALESAVGEFRNDVCKTTLAALSNGDVAYLEAMALVENGRACRTAEVAERLGVSADYGQQYRRRLLEAGVIEAPRQGYVSFAVPYLAEHLRERAKRLE